MGIALPQLAPASEDRVSGAQVIDGSLKFDKDKLTYLSRTPSSSGNRNNWTISCWLKRDSLDDNQRFFESGNTAIRFGASNFQWIDGGSGSNGENTPAAKLRDTNGWYHCVFAWDSSAGVLGNRIYVNGVELTYNQTGSGNPSGDSAWNTGSVLHTIGQNGGNSSRYYGGRMAQCYFIDGLTLGPGYFGFTDPLTNTWRPKKFKAEGTTVNDGTQWSSLVDVSNATVNNGSAANLFDGNITTKINITGGYIEIDLSSRNVHAGPEGIEVYNNEGGAYTSYQVNGGTAINWQASAGWMSMGGANSKINTIRINHLSGGGVNAAFAFRVNGVIMIDSTTTNLDFGTNGFYLPFDGSAPIGEDQSGKGNDWTPVNFGGSNSVDKATGALPILEGPGGVVANVATRTDANASNLVLALPLIGNTNDVSNQINSGSTTKVITANGDPTASTTQSNFYGGSFDFDESGDYLSVPSTSDMTFGTGDFTIEGWFYYDATSTPNNGLYQIAGSHLVNNSNTLSCNFETSGGRTQQLYFGSAGGWRQNGTDYEFPFQKWNHVAQVRSSGVIKTYINGKLSQSWADTTDYTFTHCVVGGYYSSSYLWDGYIQDFRVYKGAAKYTGDFVPASTSPDILPDTPSGVSGSSKLTKVTDGAVSFDGSGDYLSGFGGSAILPTSTGTAFVVDCFWYSNGNSSQKGIWEQHSSGSGRTAYFVNNGSAYLISEGNTVGTFTYGDKRWYFTRIIYDGTGNIYHYVDGVLIGSGTQSNGIDDTGFQIGAYSTDCFNGFVSNFRIVVGANSLSGTDVPTSPLTNITNTSLLCCQSNTSAIAAAVTPGSITANGNAAATNFNPFTTDINTVRGQETGYCTFNVLRERSGGYNPTFKDGNLFMDGRGDGTGTLSASSGKFYFEVLIDTVTTSGQIYLGVQDAAYGGAERGWSTAQIAAMRDTNTLYGNGATGSGVTYGVGDLMSFAFDADNNKLYIAKNGIYLNGGVPSQGTGFTHSGINFAGGYTPIVSDGQTGQKFRANFGQKPFKFPPPAGFQPLNGTNVRPETVITRPDQYFGTTLYTGNGATQSINAGLKPDFVWIKNRTDATSHMLFDSVRGVQKVIYSNAVTQEQPAAISVTAFNRDGFTVSSANEVNGSSDNMVAWTWKAGGAPTATNDNTSGAMDSNSVSLDGVLQSAYVPSGSPTLYPKKMSIGTRQGFSIMEYEGPGSAKSLPHGLNSAPEFIMVKRLDVNASWALYHVGLGNTKVIELNDSGSPNTSSSVWNSTTPTSSVWSIGNYADTGDSGGDYVAYLWHSVPGLQKFGTYVGNASTDGTYVELGFRPRWIMQKNTSGQEWFIHDTARDPINVAGFRLTAESNVAENGTNNTWLDILSNGFKLRTTNEAGNSGTFIYMAWAEAPTFNLYGGQSNAR